MTARELLGRITAEMITAIDKGGDMNDSVEKNIQRIKAYARQCVEEDRERQIANSDNGAISIKWVHGNTEIETP